MRWAIAALACVLVLAGCGADTDRLVTRERFVERMDRACSDATAGAPERPAAGSAEEFEYLVVTRFEPFAKAFADVDRRGLSVELNAQLDALAAANETIADRGPKLVARAAEEFGTARFTESTREFNTAVLDAQGIAQRIGFAVCAVAQP